LPDAALRALAAPFVAHAAGSVLLFDLDGTLAPIVEDPAAARPLAESVDLLDALAHRYRRVGVVSGRPVSFLADHLPAALALSGLYGLEGRIDGALVEHPEAGWWRTIVGDAAESFERRAPDGIVIEAKGLSLTVHYRTAPDAERDVLALADEVGAASGLDVRAAKMSVELHPPIEADKGTAVRSLAQGAQAVMFVGDDRGDIPGFRALADLASTGVHTAGVAIDGPGAPGELLDAADLVLEGPEAVPGLLGALMGETG
jgi:trehalose 6-phosphate phosphatase